MRDPNNGKEFEALEAMTAALSKIGVEAILEKLPVKCDPHPLRVWTDYTPWRIAIENQPIHLVEFFFLDPDMTESGSVELLVWWIVRRHRRRPTPLRSKRLRSIPVFGPVKRVIWRGPKGQSKSTPKRTLAVAENLEHDASVSEYVTKMGHDVLIENWKTDESDRAVSISEAAGCSGQETAQTTLDDFQAWISTDRFVDTWECHRAVALLLSADNAKAFD